MENFFNKFEKTITYILLIVAMIVVSYQTLELIWELLKSFIVKLPQAGLNYEPSYHSAVVVLFFSILLTLEIMETIRIFHHDHETKIKIILIVCMIAISRKLLSMDKHNEPMDYLTTAGLILAFATAYFLIKRVSPRKDPEENKPGD